MATMTVSIPMVLQVARSWLYLVEGTLFPQNPRAVTPIVSITPIIFTWWASHPLSIHHGRHSHSPYIVGATPIAHTGIQSCAASTHPGQPLNLALEATHCGRGRQVQVHGAMQLAGIVQVHVHAHCAVGVLGRHQRSCVAGLQRLMLRVRQVALVKKAAC